MIFTLTDRQYNVLDVLETDDYLIGQYTSSLLETLDITIPINSLNPEKWIEGNYIMCRDKAGNNYWFTITDFSDGFNEDTKKLSCYSGTLDVIAEDANPISATDAQPFSWYFDKIFYDTGITIGVNELDGQTRKLEYTSTDKSNAEMLQFVLNGFDNAEGQFEVEFKSSTPVGLKLNVLKRIGLEDPQTLLSDDDDSLTSLERTGSIADLGTCLNLSGAKPEGSETSITLVGKEYVEKDSAGNVLYISPKDQFRIYSIQAHNDYYVQLPGKTNGEYDGYINRRYTSEAKTQDALWAAGLAQLKKIDHAILTYTAKGKINCNIGDSIQIVSHTMKEPIMISARVIEFKFNDDDPTLNEYTFSNYVELESNLDDISALMADLKAQLADVTEKTKSFATTEQLTTVQNDVDGTKKDLEVVKTDVGTVKDGLAEINNNLAETAKVATQAGESVDLLREDLTKSIAEKAEEQTKALEQVKTDAQALVDAANKDWSDKVAEYDAEIADIQKDTAKIADIAAQGETTKQTVDEQTQTITDLITQTKDAVTAVTEVQKTAEGLKTTIGDTTGKLNTLSDTVDGMTKTVADAASKTEVEQLSDKLTISVKDAKTYTDSAVNALDVATAYATNADGSEGFTITIGGDDSPANYMYVGTAVGASDTPADYTWILNPDYLKAQYDVALADRVTSDTFIDAMAKMVGTDEYEAFKEMMDNLKESYEDFVAGEYRTEVSNLESRASGLEVQLDNKLAEFEFLRTYIKLGEEGLVIGSDDSPLKMLLAKDKLSFIDGGNTVAYFTNQSFYINRGAIVESLQVGSHKMTKINDESTVFQYVGVQ